MIAAYGSWESPVTPEVMTRASVRLTFPEVGADGSWSWVEGRPLEAGRNVVVVHSGKAGDAPRDLLPPAVNARTRVHEYGGRGHLRVADELWFVDFATQRLMHLSQGGETRALTDGAVRLADLKWDAPRRRIVAVGEVEEPAGTSHASAVHNGLVAVDPHTGALRWLARGHDFYAAPVLSPDGAELSYLAWDHPHMPWDAAALYRCKVEADGALGPPAHVAGGPQGSAFQPSYGPDGQLYACLEVRDRWTLHRFERERQVELGRMDDADVGAPLWALGMSIYGFDAAGAVVAIAFQNGFAKIVRIDTQSGAVSTLWQEPTMIGELSCRGQQALFTIGWAAQATKVMHLDLRSGERTLVRDGLGGLIQPSGTATDASSIDQDDLSTPEAITFDTSQGDQAHGFFYAPRNRRYTGPEGRLPPLVVVAHGGPTGSANPTIQLNIQFWTTRGFAVLDVNYRGSTTFGRAYREKLRGAWGLADTADCVAGAEYLAKQGRVDRERMVIRGGSAGGYTVLQALTDYDVFRAAACLYGISDPRALSASTHKFESHYDHCLFGEGEAYERAMNERAPIRKVAKVKAPIIFFQGLEDKAVPPDQTSSMHQQLVLRGIDSEYHAYAGEQHGFRRADTIRDVWTKELAFYRRVLAI